MPEPFIITPPSTLLADRPDLKHLAAQIARAYANGDYVTDEALKAMGQSLWDALAVDAAFDAATQKAGLHALPILLQSSSAALHQLPWETLYHPQHGFLAREKQFTFTRQDPNLAVDLPALEDGPLRVLLFTALPDDVPLQSRLDVEEEQAQFIEALGEHIASGQVQYQMPDDGRFATFQQLIQQFKPHLVILSGHGKFIDTPGAEPFAVFQFESDDGGSELVTDQKLAEAFIGSPVQCVLLSACESGMSQPSAELNSGLMWRLVQRGIPHVIGMRESVIDQAGTQFARAFVAAVVAQKPVPQAVQLGRSAITQPLKNDPLLKGTDLAQLALAQWCLPTLISRESERPLINWHFTPQPRTLREANDTIGSITLPPRFLGRRTELRHIKSRTREGTLAQLLITGPGGQGKTSLAGRLAHDLAQDGCWVLAYSAKESGSFADLVLELELTLDEKDKIRYNQRRERGMTEAALADFLLKAGIKHAQGKLLLFWDNLESLQAAQTPHALTDAQLAAWLAAAQSLAGRGLILLLTSRWRLPGWPDGDHWPLNRANLGDFVRMALDLVAQSKLNKQYLHEKEKLRRVHRVLHGNGRGLTTFAGAVKELDPAAEEDFLQALAATEAEVQIDMAITQTVANLAPAAAQLLQRLPAYDTPVPLEGIVKLGLDLAEPERLLDELLAVSLVEPIAQPRLNRVEFQLSPLVVAWLAEQKDVPKPTQALRQNAADFLHYLFKHEAGRRTIPYATTVHHALRRAGETDRADQVALDFIVGQLSRAGLYQTNLDTWLPDIVESTNPKIRATALNWQGLQNDYLGNYKIALSIYEQSLKISREIGDKSGEGTTLNNISQIFKARGDYDTALTFLEQSLKISREIGDKSGEGTTLNNISQIFKARGDYDTALTFLEQSLKIRREIGDKSGEGTTLNNMATTAHARGDYDTALTFLEQSLKIRREIGDKSGEGTTLNNISQIHDARGDYDTALTFLEQSLKIWREIGDKSGEGTTLNNISQIFKARGDYDTALTFLEQSLKIRREIGDKSGEGTTLNNISQIHDARGDYDTALTFLEQSLKIWREIGDKSGEGTTLNNISQIFKARGDYDTALTFLEQSLKIWREIGDKSGEGTTLNNISQIHDARGDYDTALTFLEQSLKIWREIGDKSGEGTTLNNISQIHDARGDYDTALTFLEQSLKIRREIGDAAGLCATLFNMGHIHAQNKQINEAFSAWVTVYQLAKQMHLAQALNALANLAPHVGLPPGLAGWEQLAQQMNAG